MAARNETEVKIPIRFGPEPTTETGVTPLLYQVSQAAEILGVGRTVTYHLMNTGRLKSVKIGARRLVPREAIDEFVAELLAEAS